MIAVGWIIYEFNAEKLQFDLFVFERKFRNVISVI